MITTVLVVQLLPITSILGPFPNPNTEFFLSLVFPAHVRYGTTFLPSIPYSSHFFLQIVYLLLTQPQLVIFSTGMR